MRVLLIEDDNEAARSIELMLKSEMLNVYRTSNEASPQTAEVYGQWRVDHHRIENGLRSSRQGRCPGHESSKLGGSRDPWTTGARDERSTIGGECIA
jgi:hypothetical protein